MKLIPQLIQPLYHFSFKWIVYSSTSDYFSFITSLSRQSTSNRPKNMASNQTSTQTDLASLNLCFTTTGDPSSFLSSNITTSQPPSTTTTASSSTPESTLASKRIVLGSTSKGRQQLFAEIGFAVELVASNFPEDLDKTMHPLDYVMQTAEGKINSILADMMIQWHLSQTSLPFRFPDCIITADTMVTSNFHNFSSTDPSISDPYRIIGKPENAEDAIATLTQLSGKTHQISTGVCLMLPINSSTSQDPAALSSYLSSLLSDYDQSTLYDTTDPQYMNKNGLKPTLKISKVDFSALPYTTTPTPATPSLLKALSSSPNFIYTHQQPWQLIQFTVTTSVTFDDLSPSIIEAYVATSEPFGKAGSYAIQGGAKSFVKNIEGCYQNIIGFPCDKFQHILQSLMSNPDFQWE